MRFENRCALMCSNVLTYACTHVDAYMCTTACERMCMRTTMFSRQVHVIFSERGMCSAWLKCNVREAQTRGRERAQASQGAARHGGGGARGPSGASRRAATMSRWEIGRILEITISLTIHVCGLVRGCALRRLVILLHEQPSSKNVHVVSEHI